METSPAITARDITIGTPHGGLYVRHWQLRDGRADHRAPVVLFHDSLGCVALWRDFPERLAAATGRDVIAYDRPGFGRSDPHPAKLAGDFIHDEAREGFRYLREGLSIRRFIAFGHSVGGGMAVACAATYPEDCLALITESAQAFVEARTIEGIREAQRLFARSGQVERLEKYHGDKAVWVLSAWIDSWLAPEFADWSLDDDLRQVVCPVLSIHGDQDEYGSTAHPERIASLVRGASTLRIMAGAGHVPHREQETHVIGLVDQWLAGTACM